MKGYALLILASLFFTSACLSPPSKEEVALANWPNGYKSAVTITFETEIPSKSQLASIAKVLRERGLNATFFVIAGYFEGKEEVLEEIRGFEVGNLAWMQREWRERELTQDFQRSEIIRADAWLRSKGFSPIGYRAPFLKANADTYVILEDLGYTYDASQWFGFYPYRIGGIIEVPLSLNYDLYWSDYSMSRSMLPTYLAFQESYDKEGLFTFYAHTNKVYLNMNNFTHFLDYARQRNVWFASTGEVAEWWSKREKLQLNVVGNRIIVTNKGDRAVAGATLKLKSKKTLKGAVMTKKSEDVTYAVLPEINPNSQIILEYH
jgi:peptidoglycan/xylan/chitin deacetylase (PgdA/CDA1 family)